MSEVAYTPGPWRVGYKSLHVLAENSKIGGDAMVCEIRGWGYLTGNGHGALGLDPKAAALIQDANAKLIAAAPEMLEALKEARANFKTYDRFKVDVDAMRKIEGAIAKAEGRS